MNNYHIPAVAMLTQGSAVPSTRFRFEQNVPDLIRSGLDVRVFHSKHGAYPPSSHIARPTWLIKSLADGFNRVRQANKLDICLIQREIVSTLFTAEALITVPFVLDVDDAIFLNSRFNSANHLAKCAALTICGNSYLAEYFSTFGPVEIIPTAVDTDIFKPTNGSGVARQVIGWSGSSSGLKYLYNIESAIKVLLHRYPEAVFKVVSDKAPKFETLPVDQVVFEQWGADREAAVLQEFTVGLMPLEDDLWARGKCSFKMLTYMATGLPVVVSPVGMNVEILSQGQCGIAAKTIDDWVDAISSLLLDSALAKKMGQIGRSIVETHYARNVIAPKLAQLLKKQL